MRDGEIRPGGLLGQRALGLRHAELRLGLGELGARGDQLHLLIAVVELDENVAHLDLLVVDDSHVLDLAGIRAATLDTWASTCASSVVSRPSRVSRVSRVRWM